MDIGRRTEKKNNPTRAPERVKTRCPNRFKVCSEELTALRSKVTKRPTEGKRGRPKTTTRPKGTEDQSGVAW